ncbi:hypothetical protein DF186_20370, partial [Enterococcus hirae]
GAEIATATGEIVVRDGGQVHRIGLGDLAENTLGYVIQAEESYDPPTRPLDANGQGAPYAQFGYAAHICMVEVDPALGTCRAVK